MITKKITTGILSFLMISAVSAHAGWVDDWLEQRTMTSPDYLSGQQRGYYTAGGFSTRWPSKTAYPVTIEPPRLKAGCGGIDVFVGGFSFMNKEYLVDKLQGILSNAAAVAFDLGLKTLCEQCSQTIKNFEAISDKLNSMQIDECAAGKELVGIMMDEGGFHSSEVMKSNLSTAIKENKLSKGVSEMWDMVTKEDISRNNVPQAGDVQRITQGCNSDLQQVFLRGDSLLSNVSNGANVSPNYINLIRGLVGDIKLSGPASAYKISYIPPCPQNNVDDFSAASTGNLFEKTATGNCQLITDSNGNLKEFVKEELVNIADKIENQGTLTVGEKEFLKVNPLPILPVLKTAVATDIAEATIDSLAGITSNAYSYQMLTDLYSRASAITDRAYEILEKKADARSGAGSDECSLVFGDQVAQNISKMASRIAVLQDKAHQNYVQSAQEMTIIYNYIDHIRKIDRQLQASLSNPTDE